jgi:rhodanese-related sulfurtransferase
MRRGRLGPSTIAISILCAVWLLYACGEESPVREVNARSLKKLIDEGRVTVIDTRTDVEYGQAFIPGAIHLPEERFSQMGPVLPEDRNAAVVFYCRGYG